MAKKDLEHDVVVLSDMDPSDPGLLCGAHAYWVAYNLTSDRDHRIGGWADDQFHA